MDTLNELPTVARAIQQAVAPVFLLTGIGSILSVLTNRLGRAVDRFRKLGEQKRMTWHRKTREQRTASIPCRT